MKESILLLPICLPLLAGILTLAIPQRIRGLKETLALLATLTTFIITVLIFKSDLSFSLPWCGTGLEFSLRLYAFSAFIIACIAGFGFLLALYSSVFMADKPVLNQFYAYFLFVLGLSIGAVLSNNLILLLFFWEGLLLPIFGLIFMGKKEAFKTAVKAFIILGISDLCLMLGVALTGMLAGTFTLSQINLPLTNLGALAFLSLTIGALAKAGCMPFHSWIPDAALDAPLPFMALLPGCLEKLIGIYFLTRICLDLFQLSPNSWLSPLLMIIGGLTILLAVMMALVQKDYKKLLSYHAISQVGYMVLGIGTAVPLGIVGGLFHMLNNALYKCGLFLSGGAVEKQTGTTDLNQLGGLARQMPVTFLCFFIAALSISGVPPFNGFFSKELVYDAALERGWFFYLAAVLGSFFTAASFLKLGHAAFWGKSGSASQKVKEASWPMLLPMLIIAALCLLFGLYNPLPLNQLIGPVVGAQKLAGHPLGGFPANTLLVAITLLVLLAAVGNHLWGVKRTGKALGAADHIHHAPLLYNVYAAAEKKQLDPYEWGMRISHWFAMLLWAMDRLIDWIYDVFAVRTAFAFSWALKKLHSGNFSTYVLWALIGTTIMILFTLRF